MKSNGRRFGARLLGCLVSGLAASAVVPAHAAAHASGAAIVSVLAMNFVAPALVFAAMLSILNRTLAIVLAVIMLPLGGFAAYMTAVGLSESLGNTAVTMLCALYWLVFVGYVVSLRWTLRKRPKQLPASAQEP